MGRADKYGRGSAAANGEGFVDLSSGDTFAAVEDQLKRRVADRFDNLTLGISAIIGSKRNASELAKHLASGEGEEVHKFAAKNIGVLFARGRLGVSHFDKKAKDETREKPMILRVFAAFVFAERPFVATITIKPADSGLRLYAIEALDIMRDERPEVHLAAKPRQFKTTRLLLVDRISYYVGDVNRTNPKFIGREEPFSSVRTAELLEEMMREHNVVVQSSSVNFRTPVLSIIVPSYNMEKYLPKCLGSLVIDAEHMEKLEVLVVNDGSKDRTSEIAHEFAAKWPGTFKVIDKPNGNYGSCINAALPFATGTWVKVLDADDWFKTENLPEFLDFLARADADVDLVFSAYTRYRPTGEVVHHSEWPFPTNGAFDFDVFAGFSGNDLTMHAYTYRTDHVRGLGYRQTEGVSYSDIEWACIPLAGIKKIAYFPKDIYQYLAGRPGQTMDAERFAANFWQGAEVVLHMVEVAKGLGLRDDVRANRFVRRRILELIEAEYRTGCFGVNGRKANFDVADFDKRLKTLSPEDYAAVGAEIYSPRFRYRFIKGFRRGSLKDWLLLFIGRSYPKMRRLLK